MAFVNDNNGCTSTPTPCMNGSKPEYVNCNSYFEIKEGTKTNNIIFKDKQVIKNNSDIFEQNNVEDATKRNFAISAANKLRLALIDY